MHTQSKTQLCRETADGSVQWLKNDPKLAQCTSVLIKPPQQKLAIYRGESCTPTLPEFS
jgi:hypothetical protein